MQFFSPNRFEHGTEFNILPGNLWSVAEDTSYQYNIMSKPIPIKAGQVRGVPVGVESVVFAKKIPVEIHEQVPLVKLVDSAPPIDSEKPSEEDGGHQGEDQTPTDPDDNLIVVSDPVDPIDPTTPDAPDDSQGEDQTPPSDDDNLIVVSDPVDPIDPETPDDTDGGTQGEDQTTGDDSDLGLPEPEPEPEPEPDETPDA